MRKLNIVWRSSFGIFAATLIILLVGCQRSNVYVFENVDPSEKSMTVPAGASSLLVEIKLGLRREGWKTVVDQGPRVITGTVGSQTRLEAADTFHTRYRLHVAETRVDLCFTGSPTVAYNLSLIDNDTGAEVLAMSGRDCASWAASKFLKAIGADSES